MIMQLNHLFTLLALAGLSQAAICPGYNFGFYNLGKPPGGTSGWAVTDDSCNLQNGRICWNDNPCNCAGLSCTSAPVHVGDVEVNGLWYYCRHDVNPGNCYINQPGYQIIGAVPESCCRNDGKRNLAEGRINERQFAAIEQTAALLDKQKREYDEEVERGMSPVDVSAMRAVHKRSLDETEMKEYEAGF